jgi:hypothetical protein
MTDTTSCLCPCKDHAGAHSIDAPTDASRTMAFFLKGDLRNAYYLYAMSPWAVVPILEQPAFEAAMQRTILRQIASESIGHVAND